MGVEVLFGVADIAGVGVWVAVAVCDGVGVGELLIGTSIVCDGAD